MSPLRRGLRSHLNKRFTDFLLTKPPTTIPIIRQRFAARKSTSFSGMYVLPPRPAFPSLRPSISKDIEAIFRQVDRNNDGMISKEEFRACIVSHFGLNSLKDGETSHENVVTRPTNQQLRLVMLGSAIPFVGFGLVDNIILLAAGDMIEDYFHGAYHISILCAAALGNTVSDVIGLSLGGVIEQFARKIGIPDPNLSKKQANMAITHWCNFFASAIGITVGCLLGMVPLLFMDRDGEKLKVKKESGASVSSLRIELVS